MPCQLLFHHGGACLVSAGQWQRKMKVNARNEGRGFEQNEPSKAREKVIKVPLNGAASCVYAGRARLTGGYSP